MSAALLAYGLATRLLEPLAPALLRRRASRGKEDHARLDERLGHPGLERPPGELVWLHGASVGETLSLLPLIDRLRSERPDLALLVTSGTRTSAELLGRRLPEGVIHQYAPVDGPEAVSRFLDHWRPALGVFVESELWPNLLTKAKARGVKLALVSARVTDDTVRGWSRARGLASRLLGGFDLILAQDIHSTIRLQQMGAHVAGEANLKLIGEPLPYDRAEFQRLSQAIGERQVVLGASTHHGEDEHVISAVEMAAVGRPVLTILVPRHPDRAGEIASRQRAFRPRDPAPARRSLGEPLTADTRIYLADTLGELGLFLRLADVVVMGGSFTTGIGGHNPLEAARLGKGVLHGDDLGNWSGVYSDLEFGGGSVRCGTEGELAQAIDRLLSDPVERARLNQAAAVVARRADAGIAPLMGRLAPLLPPMGSRR